MSNLTLLEVKLQNVNQHILLEAAKMLANHLKLEVHQNNYIRDYYGRKQLCQIVLRGEGAQYGIGLNITRDGVQVVGDHMQKKLKTVQERIKQFYIAAANQQALQALGYTTSVKITEKEILLEAIGL